MCCLHASLQAACPALALLTPKPDPSRQAGRPDHAARPKGSPEVGYMSPFGHFQWLLLGWPDCAALGSLHMDGDFPNRRRFPEAIKVPRPQAQFNPQVWCTCLAWLCGCKGTFNPLHQTRTSLSSGWSTRDSTTIPLPKVIISVSFKQFCHRLSVGRNVKTRTAVNTMCF